MASKIFRCGGIAVALLSITGGALAQGSLTPPGAPAPTMRTLEEIHATAAEPPHAGIAINAQNTPGTDTAMFVISVPGRYYLTDSFTAEEGKSGIELLTGNVHIDLNGNTLTGSATSQDGIYGPGTVNNVTIENGTLSGWTVRGIFLDHDVTVRNCTFLNGPVLTVALGGRARIDSCSFYECVNGVSVDRDPTITNCKFYDTEENAINIADSGGMVSGCTIHVCKVGIAQGSGGGAIFEKNTFQNCTVAALNLCSINLVRDNVISVSAVGVQARCGGNVIRHNHFANNTTAITLNANNKEQVHNNTFFTNATNVTNTTGNYVAPLTTVSAATNPFSNLTAP